MLRTIELFWFGTGFIGVLLTGSIVARRYPEKWRNRNGYGSIHTAIGLSYAGPINLLPALLLMANPMALGMCR